MDSAQNNIYVDRFKDILKHEHFLLGIGEISKATGVSQRQLRYWEEKGYIKSEESKDDSKKCDHRHRKYSHFTFLKVSMIQSFINDGYTLNAAVQKTDAHSLLSKAVKQFLKERILDVTVVQNGYELNLGSIDGVPGKHVYAVIQKNANTKLILKDFV
ncbi:MerR family transcriptional regulator [Liquorilactobacillus mali]|uniref:MerR family transcriptional regulator n=1 Tax=Liquorilactobacillus mali TaxID=1618 RepID=UPI002954B48F|nr:MerR family transcriptional regulator [Liquorilactobacillus mali]MDV7757417.1 MerR family transcriptional regulator [Liquorilactobacillus mali]